MLLRLELMGVWGASHELLALQICRAAAVHLINVDPAL